MAFSLSACLRMMRPVNSFMVGLAVIVGIFIAAPHGTVINPIYLVAGFLVGFLISASSMVLNDIADIKIDMINAPHRPLPSGQVTIRQAKTCYIVLTAMGLAISFVGGLDSFLTVLAATAASALYNLRLKLAGFPGNIAVAFLTSIPFLYAFTLLDQPNPAVIIFWGMVFLTVLAREIAKDIADVEGDSVKGARTLPIVYGRKVAAIVSAIFYVVAVALSPLPVLFGLVERPLVYIVGVLIVDSILLYSSIILVLSPRKRTVLFHKKIVLVAMLVGLITFLTASV